MTSWTQLLRRRWSYGLVVFVIVFGTGAAILFLTRPIYRAEARLRLNDPPPSGGVTPTAGGFFGLPRLNSDPFANDLELITSRTIAERLVADAALNAQLEAPRYWYRDSLFTLYAASARTEKARFRADWLESGRVRVREVSPSDSLIGDVAPGTPTSFGGVTLAFRAWRAD